MYSAERGLAGHFGLHGMRERARLIGGTLTTIQSEHESGTEVEISIPAPIAYGTSANGLRSWFLREPGEEGIYFRAMICSMRVSRVANVCL